MEISLKTSFDDVDRKIRRINPKRVLLQLPSGLKRRASEFAEEITKRYGCEVLISGDSCYGACDILMPAFSIDAIIQIGHAPMNTMKCSTPVIFIPVTIDIDLTRMIASAIPNLKSPVGLLATAQHLHQIKEAKRILEDRKFKVLVGRGSKRLASPGHILGCDYSSAKTVAEKAKSFLLLGGGEFHALGAFLITRKPVIILDPERDNAIVETVDFEKILKRRFAVIQALANAPSIGIIISTKIGQNRLGLAKRLKKAAISRRKKCEIVMVDEITPDKLTDLGFQAYISTACPRIALDDSKRYSYPIGTPSEFMIALGERDWRDYQIDDWNYRLGKKKRGK